MGYYTKYKIRSVEGCEIAEIYNALAAKSGHSKQSIQGDSMKWYDHEDDIRAVMPSTGCTFLLLRGDGENRDDHWEKEFRLVDGVVTIQTFKLALTRVP